MENDLEGQECAEPGATTLWWYFYRKKTTRPQARWVSACEEQPSKLIFCETPWRDKWQGRKCAETGARTPIGITNSSKLVLHVSIASLLLCNTVS